MQAGAGSVWTWTAIDADSKLIISYTLGDRGADTAHVERSNLSMRMGMRRFTRLTNGFSNKLENHGHAVALFPILGVVTVVRF
jgi:IS1 family transposase